MPRLLSRKPSPTTLNTDRFLLPTPGQRSGRSGTEAILPTWFRKLHIGKVTRTAVEKWQDDLLACGLAPTTVKRHRESLSSFFTWCLSEGYIASNPVKSTAPPKDRRARERMRQLLTPELDEVVAAVTAVTAVSPVYADLVRVLAHTGLRWGEARAMLVRDCSEVPMLSVIRNQPEGVAAAQTPKSGQSRCVPLPDALLPVIRRFAEGKSPDDSLFTDPAAGSCTARCSSGRRTVRRSDTGAPSSTCATPRPASGSFRVCR